MGLIEFLGVRDYEMRHLWKCGKKIMVGGGVRQAEQRNCSKL